MAGTVAFYGAESEALLAPGPVYARRRLRRSSTTT